MTYDFKSQGNNFYGRGSIQSKGFSAEVGQLFTWDMQDVKIKEDISIKAKTVKINDSDVNAGANVYINADLFACKNSVIKAANIYLPIKEDVELNNCKLIGNIHYEGFNDEL